MGEFNWDVVKELMSGSMYWVSTMKNDAGKTSRDEEWENKNRTTKCAQLLRERFGDDTLEIVQGEKRVTMMEYFDRCDVLYNELLNEMDAVGDLPTELEDILFYAGEVYFTIEKVMKLLVMLGCEGATNDYIDELGESFGVV